MRWSGVIVTDSVRGAGQFKCSVSTLNDDRPLVPLVSCILTQLHCQNSRYTIHTTVLIEESSKNSCMRHKSLLLSLLKDQSRSACTSKLVQTGLLWLVLVWCWSGWHPQ